MREIRRTIGFDSVAKDGSVRKDIVARARILHLAEGVLVGLLGETPGDAFAALMDAARTSGLSPYVVADELVSIAARERPLDNDHPAAAAVRHNWGHLLTSRSSAG
jgi:hypothetical protein